MKLRICVGVVHLVCFVSLHMPVVMSAASYKPGISPRTYLLGESIPLRVDALSSTKTQIPVDYYKLPFCEPESGPKMELQSLGQLLEGSRIMSSPFEINMAAEFYCVKLCQVIYSQKEYEKVLWHVQKRYHYNWLLDHLPSAAIGSFSEIYANGFPIGFLWADNEYYILNHFNIVIDFHKVPGGGGNGEMGYRVVEFAVEPISVEHKFEGGYTWDGMDSEGFSKPLVTCPYRKHLSMSDVASRQRLLPNTPIMFTYDVIWRDSGKPWSDRWQIYLSNNNMIPMNIHWMSISNSALCLFFLSLMMIAIWVKVTKPPSAENTPFSARLTVGTWLRSIRNTMTGNHPYSSVSRNEYDTAAREQVPLSAVPEDPAEVERVEREREEERNWRRLRGDVFRPPGTLPGLFCALVGTGAQLFVTCLGVALLAACGIVSQAVPGTIPNAFLVLFNISGFVAGYVSYRLYASFGAGPILLMRCVKMVALIFPACVFASFCFLNICLATRESTASLPASDVFILLLGWLFGMIPLVCVGAYIARLHDVFEYPVHTNPIPREIPQHNCFKRPFWGIPVAGLLPFGALYVELHFAMTSLWMRQYYYVFGIALIVYTLAIMTAGITSSVMVYFQLAFENHRWWWFSMICGGSVGIYIALYATMFASYLDLDSSFVTYVIYYTYVFWIGVGVFLIFGAVGTLSALFFMLKLYSTIDREHNEPEVTSNGNEEAGYIMLDAIGSSSIRDADGQNDAGDQQGQGDALPSATKSNEASAENKQESITEPSV